jgi:hypothetical protein
MNLLTILGDDAIVRNKPGNHIGTTKFLGRKSGGIYRLKHIPNLNTLLPMVRSRSRNHFFMLAGMDPFL